MNYLYASPYLAGKIVLNPHPILGAAQLIIWLFGHPSAWKRYIAEIAPDLDPNFSILELQPHHRQNKALRRILVSSYLILPFLIALINITWLALSGQSQSDIIRGTILSYMYCLTTTVLISHVHSMALGIGYGFVLGLCIGVPAHMGGILFAVLLAAGLGGQLAVDTAPDYPRRSLPEQIVGGTIGLLTIIVLMLAGYIIMSGSLLNSQQVAQLGEGIPEMQAAGFALGGGMVLGAVFATIARLRLTKARFAIQVGILITIILSFTYGNSLRIPHTNLVIHVFGAIGGSILFTGIFLLPYMLFERAGGPRLGAFAGAYANGMSWLPLYSFLIFENEPINPLLLLPYAHVWIALIILAGLTVHYWLPVVIYPFSSIWNQILYQRDLRLLPHSRPVLIWNSVFWDEFQFLPLRGLDKHLVLVTRHDRDLGHHFLQIVSASRQHWAAQEAQLELDVLQLEELHSIDEIAKAHQRFVIGSTLENPVNVIFNTFSLISQDAQVALNHTSTFHKRLGLKAIEDRLNGLLRDITRSEDLHVHRFYSVASEWLRVVQESVAELERAVEDTREIDNPYIVGVPLTEQQKIFVGRSDIALRLEQWLSTQRCPPLFLYGQRRMGKTSLLLNLGRLMRADIVPLFVDAQYIVSGNSLKEIIINAVNEFNRSISRVQKIHLPMLDLTNCLNDTATTLNAWFDQIESTIDRAGFSSVLMAMDEFDALYAAAKLGRIRETNLLYLLRYMMQHRTRFKVLLTSAQPPDEFEDWTSQLINLQVIHLGPLKPKEARQLIEQPTQDFALAYTPEASQRVIDLSGGHPFLLQLLCYEIVLHKNAQPLSERYTARLEDIETSIQPALSSGQFFFEGIQRQGIDDVGRSALKQIATAGEEALVAASNLTAANQDHLASQLRVLLKRELIREVEPDTFKFNIELIRRWFTR
jgi:hypothetical protein